MINLISIEDDLSIYQLNTTQEIPSQFHDSTFFSMTKTDDETSIVSNLKLEIPGAKVNHGWKAFKIKGILDLSLIGLINDITYPLKINNISVFIISTYNTDYILVKREKYLETVEILNKTNNIRII
jgi:hypothetical protein